jgi:hypothetical protein
MASVAGGGPVCKRQSAPAFFDRLAFAARGMPSSIGFLHLPELD